MVQARLRSLAMAIRLETDVLVIGGGIAGAFAAYRAREAGARVLLADRSYFGRSGCSALASGVYPSYMPGDDIDACGCGPSAGPWSINRSWPSRCR